MHIVNDLCMSVNDSTNDRLDIDLNSKLNALSNVRVFYIILRYSILKSNNSIFDSFSTLIELLHMSEESYSKLKIISM